MGERMRWEGEVQSDSFGEEGVVITRDDVEQGVH